MKFRSFLTCFALLFCVTLAAQTTAERTSERAKRRAENRANSRLDQGVDRAVDGAINAVGSLFKRKKRKKEEAGSATTTPAQADNPTPPPAGAGGLFGLGKWTPYTNPVSFSVQMEITEEKKGKTSTSTMAMAVLPTRFGLRFEDPEAQEKSRMILNTEDGKTTLITTDKQGKTEGFRMRMPGLRPITEETAAEHAEGISFTNTGEQRVIDGYNCTKYLITDSKNKITTESWVTTEVELNTQDIFAGMMNAFGNRAKSQRGATSGLAGGFTGFPILSVSTDGKTTWTSRFRDLKVGESTMDKSLLDTSGVPIQSVGF